MEILETHVSRGYKKHLRCLLYGHLDMFSYLPKKQRGNSDAYVIGLSYETKD